MSTISPSIGLVTLEMTFTIFDLIKQCQNLTFHDKQGFNQIQGTTYVEKPGCV